MTEKQKRFCDYYIANPNATQAAIKAGYSKKTAKEIAGENLTKPAIKQYIEKRSKELENERIMSAVEILEFFTDVIQDTEQKMADRIKTAELLGKTKAMFVDRSVTHSTEVDENKLDELIATLNEEGE